VAEGPGREVSSGEPFNFNDLATKFATQNDHTIVDFGFAWNFGTSGRDVWGSNKVETSFRVFLLVGDAILSSTPCLR